MRRRNSSSCLLISFAKAFAAGVLTAPMASSSKARGCRPQQSQGRNLPLAGRRDIVRQAVRASATTPGQNPYLAQSRAVLSSILLISYWQ